MKSIVMTVL